MIAFFLRLFLLTYLLRNIYFLSLLKKIRCFTRICLDESKSSFLTISMPGPRLSLACHLSREKSDIILGMLRETIEEEGEEHDLIALVEAAKSLVEAETKVSIIEPDEEEDKHLTVEVLVAKLDHMRDSAQYLKTLSKWTSELNLVMLVVVAKDVGVVVVVEGEEGALTNLITRYRSYIGWQ